MSHQNPPPKEGSEGVPQSEETHSYEAGLREGRLRGIEETIQNHGTRLDRHENRLTAQERITYALLGAIALIEILPAVQRAVSG